MSLSRSPRVVLSRRVAFGFAVVCGVWAGYLGVQSVLRGDAFASLRERVVPGFDENTGIRTGDVELRQYKGGQLVAKTHAETLTVSRDRHEIGLENLTKGEYHNEHGKATFSADKGKWNAEMRRLELTGKTKIAGKEGNFTTESIVVDDRTKKINIPQPMTGNFKNGETRVASLVYDMKSGGFEAGKANWSGKLQDAQEITQDTRTKWDVSADKTTSDGNKTNTQTYTNATATDGDILVRAPKIERNTKTDVLVCTGRVFYYSSKSDLVADKIVIYRKEKRAVLSGTVLMLVKPKDAPKGAPKVEEIPPFRPLVPEAVSANRPPAPNGPSPEEKELDKKLRDGKSIREYPLVISATDIEYWYAKGSRHANISGNPQARQDLPGGRWRHVWTHTAKYDGEAETLLMESTPKKLDVIYKSSIGEDLKASSFLISTKEDDESYSGDNITGSLYGDEEDDPRDKTKKKTEEKTTGGGGGG